MSDNKRYQNLVKLQEEFNAGVRDLSHRLYLLKRIGISVLDKETGHKWESNDALIESLGRWGQFFSNYGTTPTAFDSKWIDLKTDIGNKYTIPANVLSLSDRDFAKMIRSTVQRFFENQRRLAREKREEEEKNAERDLERSILEAKNKIMVYERELKKLEKLQEKQLQANS